MSAARPKALPRTYKQGDNMLEFGAFSAFVIAILVLAVVLIFMGVKAVPQGWEYTVERFGRYTRG